VRVNDGAFPLLLVELFENPNEWAWGVWSFASGLDAIGTGEAPSRARAKRAAEREVKRILKEALADARGGDKVSGINNETRSG